MTAAMRVHVLSPGFTTPNGRAFLFPMTVWQRPLADAGFDIRHFRSRAPGLTDCDVLLVDSKFHRDLWFRETPHVVDEFGDLARRCRVIYCDTTDSSGWIQTELLPVVHVYAKSQLLKDRSAYSRPMYGHRPYTDYFHSAFGVNDAQPEWSTAVDQAALLNKLRLSWNSGLADYSLHGPLRMAAYGRVPLRLLLAFSRAITRPDAPRPHDLSCRFGVSYPRATVAYQRAQIRERLAKRMDTRKLSRRAYFQELANSKAVISPFGFGEITLKDFEVFLTGGLLIKPDMAHLETWPDMFRAGETMLAHRWDLSDFDAVVAGALDRYDALIAVARTAQDDYSRHLTGPEAHSLFCDQFARLVA